MLIELVMLLAAPDASHWVWLRESDRGAVYVDRQSARHKGRYATIRVRIGSDEDTTRTQKFDCRQNRYWAELASSQIDSEGQLVASRNSSWAWRPVDRPSEVAELMDMACGR